MGAACGCDGRPSPALLPACPGTRRAPASCSGLWPLWDPRQGGGTASSRGRSLWLHREPWGAQTSRSLVRGSLGWKHLVQRLPEDGTVPPAPTPQLISASGPLSPRKNLHAVLLCISQCFLISTMIFFLGFLSYFEFFFFFLISRRTEIWPVTFSHWLLT